MEGEWVENVVGLHDVKDAYAMLRTPDGEANIELIQFYRPTGEKDRERPLANTPGIRQIAGVGEDMEAGVAKLKKQGAESVGRIETYEDTYQLCYIRGPEGMIVELAEPVTDMTSVWRDLYTNRGVHPNRSLANIPHLFW